MITLGAGSIGSLPDRLIEALGGPQSMSTVAAPADRRFRRAHVKPSRKVATARAGRVTAGPVRAGGGLTAYVLYLGSAASRTPAYFKVDRIVVRGNERLSKAT